MSSFDAWMSIIRQEDHFPWMACSTWIETFDQYLLPIHITQYSPFLDDGSLDCPGVGLGPGAHLLGHLGALLVSLELRHELGDVATVPDRLHITLLHGMIHHNCLDLIVTSQGSLTLGYLSEEEIGYLVKCDHVTIHHMSD